MTGIAGWRRLLSGAFRPFFLLAAFWMAGSILVWVPLYMGHAALPTAFAPRDWHIHAMLFGGVPAIIAGFTLTAVSSWTGRPTITGRPLAVLALIWLAGRIAVSVSALTGPVAAALIDLAFPIALAVMLGREVMLAGNWRNLRVVGLVLLLALADAGFHAEAMENGLADISVRAALSAVLMLILLMGGRITPAFTRNWLKARGESRLPAPFDRFDAVAMIAAGLAFIAWTVSPAWVGTAALLGLAGLLTAARLTRWRGLAARSEPLLLVLHVAIATVAAGFLVEALAILWPAGVDPAAALHLWTAGSVGLTVLGVMTRVSRGHTGRPLTAGRLELAIYALVSVGALLRMAAPYTGDAYFHVLACAGLLWAAAFLAFAIGYAGILTGPRADGRA
ncbi:NnrS family protein [Pleomorphomonas carboxyditropha]|uniref:NnrS family protein n=1 Tax=Pleomorphomonas carboxyditropha TaxID=2023338 RepID=A0A2G9WRC1_9HYPH|nr:NnrS family protein [Pleomorphomonas carboxyditropha]PIO97214.1 NnrS family protein [Pleomorphomonas carboxyditropha]